MPIVITITELFNKIEDRSKEDIIELAEQRFEKRLAQLDVKIERVRADLIKWMFIFWVGQVGVLIGILFAFFK